MPFKFIIVFYCSQMLGLEGDVSPTGQISRLKNCIEKFGISHREYIVGEHTFGNEAERESILLCGKQPSGDIRITGFKVSEGGDCIVALRFQIRLYHSFVVELLNPHSRNPTLR